MSAIGIFEAIKQADLKIPLYNPVLYPFSKVFEGFMIKLLINKKFFTFDEYKNDTRVAKIGNVLKEKKFNRYIKDINRNENVLEQLKIAWEVLRCDELHSDPAQNANISDLDDIQQVDNLIGSISDAILKGYRIIVANGYTEEEMIANKKSESIKQSSTVKNTPNLKEIPIYNSHIGTDESGKGDYFGPLVVVGVFVNTELESKLLSIGVQDSKKNSDNKNHEIAQKIKSLLGENNYSIVFIGPEKYNELYSKLKNLNILLAWGHARSIENILNKVSCNHAIADQFGDEKYIKDALLKNGKSIELTQTTKGERDIAVAAASILARDMYLNQLQLLSNKCKIDLPKGANKLVEERAKLIVSLYGEKSLTSYAKLHFKTTEKVIK